MSRRFASENRLSSRNLFVQGVKYFISYREEPLRVNTEGLAVLQNTDCNDLLKGRISDALAKCSDAEIRIADPTFVRRQDVCRSDTEIVVTMNTDPFDINVRRKLLKHRAYLC